MVSQRSMDTSNGSMMLCGCLPRPRNKARSCAHRHATMTTGATAWHDANGATDRDARLAHVTRQELVNVQVLLCRACEPRPAQSVLYGSVCLLCQFETAALPRPAVCAATGATHV